MDCLFVDLFLSLEGILFWRIPVYFALALAQASSTITLLTGLFLYLAFSGRLGTVEWILWGLAIGAYLALIQTLLWLFVSRPFPPRARERWINLSMERLPPAEHIQFSEAAEAVSPKAPFVTLLGWRLTVEAHLWRFGRGYSEEFLARWARIGEGSIGERLTTTAVFFQKAAEIIAEE